jgi:hypothetical protein
VTAGVRAADSADPDALDRLRAFARVQVRSGYLSDEGVVAAVAEAARDDLGRAGDAEALAREAVRTEVEALEREQRSWGSETDVDRLFAVFADLKQHDVVVLPAVDDHWDVNDVLTRFDEAGERVAGALFFTHTDVWHAVDHGMLELSLWHGDTANVGVGDDLLALVLQTLAAHGLAAAFDEGRIETTVVWQRRREPTGR